MGNRLKPARINIKEYHAKICQDMLLEFRDQIKLPTDTENYYNDHRKLKDYDLQHFRDYVSKFIKDF